MRGHRRPARACAVKERVAALRIPGKPHDQAAVDFSYNLPLVRQPSRARAAAADAITAAEVLIVRIRRQLDGSCLGIDVVRIDITRVVGTPNELEWLRPAVVF